MSEVKRRRCFFDVTIDGELAGRIVFELYDDIVPITTENFVKLCTGEAGIGKTTGKPLAFKGTFFHRIVKNFMIQGGDTSAGNGTGGESIYGGVFDDENFQVKHDQPFLLSMANRGPNTNGSQFFITTNAASHLNDVHVVFGRVISGQDVVTQVEQLKVNSKNRPVNDVVVSACGQLIKKKADGAEDEEETVAKQKKRKKQKRKSSEEEDNGRVSQDKENELDKHYSTVKPEDLPEVPVTNSFLMRNSPTRKTDSGYNERSNRVESSRRHDRRSRSPNARLKIKGRGRLLYRSPSREGSSTPPHWKREADRLISMGELKRIQETQKKLAADREAEEMTREKESGRQETSEPRAQAKPDQRADDRRERPTDHRSEKAHSNRREHEESRYKGRYNEAARPYPNRGQERVRPTRQHDHNRHEYGYHNENNRKQREFPEQRTERYREEHHSEKRRADRKPERRRDDNYPEKSRDDYQSEKKRDDYHTEKSRNDYYSEKSRDKHAEQSEQRGHDTEPLQYYEQRRQRRLSDIEREKYRKGDLANIQPDIPSQPVYEDKRPVQPTITTVDYPPVPGFYPAQQSQFLTQKAPSYQSASKPHLYITDPVALAAAAAEYAKNVNAGNHPTGSVPAGHYSSTSSSSKEPKKKTAVPDSHAAVEAETPVQPSTNSSEKDRAKRTREVAETEPVAPPQHNDSSKSEKSLRPSFERDKRRESPASKHRRVDESGDRETRNNGGRYRRREERLPDRRRDRRRSSDNNRRGRRRCSSTSSSSSSSSGSSSSSSDSSRDRSRRRNSRDRSYRRR